MANRFHLSPTGLKPCEATVRTCKYGHVNSDGSFTKSTSIKEMAQLVEGLQNEIVKNPYDTTHYDLYFAARKTYEQHLDGTADLDVEDRLNVTYTSTLPMNVEITEENYDEIRDMLVAKAANIKNDNDEINVIGELHNLLSRARYSTDPEEQQNKRILAEELIAATMRHRALDSYRSLNENLGNQEWVAEAILKNPYCYKDTGQAILGSDVSYDLKRKYADSVPAGWVAVVNNTKWSKEGSERKEEAVQAAAVQISEMKNGSLDFVQAAGFINKTSNKTPVSFNTILDKIDPNVDTYKLSQSKDNYPGSTILKQGSENASTLSKSQLVKLVQIGNKMGSHMERNEDWSDSATYVKEHIVEKAFNVGNKVMPGKPFTYRTYTPEQRRKLLYEYNRTASSREAREHERKAAELAHDVAHYSDFEIEIKHLDRQRKISFLNKQKLAVISKREAVVTERMVKAKRVRDWDALTDYISNAKRRINT